jgi:hypothetical protein
VSTHTSSRTTPLSATPLSNGSEAHDVEIVHVAEPAGDVATKAQRQQRFADGLRTLRVGGGTLRFGERTLMLLGGVLAPTGAVIVLLGWWGASQTPFVFEQVPYLISGGLFGLALVFLGAFFYFAHWLTELVREHRAQSTAIVEALQRLQDQVTQLGAGSVPAAAGGPAATRSGVEEGADVVLVATARGTMAHRPDCVVVAGKDDLRRVTLGHGLTSCKLCDPASP